MTGSAKQSTPPQKESVDCFVARAPRNDEETAEATHSLPAAATKSYRCSGRGKLPPRRCEPSEAIHLAARKKGWISSSLFSSQWRSIVLAGAPPPHFERIGANHLSVTKLHFFV